MMNRRHFLELGATWALCSLPLAALAAPVVRILRGPVFVNNVAADGGTHINADDRIAVGNGGELEFALGPDAFRLGERSLLQFERAADADAGALRLITGTLLAVLAQHDHASVIEVPNATVALDGGAIYLQAGGAQVYTCTCYGRSSISAGGATTEVVAVHHSGHLISRTGRDVRILAGNGGYCHVDADVVRLAGYVALRPGAAFSAPREAP